MRNNGRGNDNLSGAAAYPAFLLLTHDDIYRLTVVLYYRLLKKYLCHMQVPLPFHYKNII